MWGSIADDPKGTHENGFFDKEAAYTGVRQPQAGAAAFQTQFRDNTFRKFVVDLYVPKAEGVVQSDHGTALTTTASRWSMGTPRPGNVDPKGTFFMKGGSGQHFFASTAKPGAQQRNWSTNAAATHTWGQVMGQVTDFLTAGNWSSDPAKPQVFTVKWEFAPTVNNTLPTTVGFAAGGARYYETTVEGARIEGKVQGKSDGSGTSPALFNEQELHTGSGTSNGLDGKLYWGTDLDAANNWKQKPNDFSGYYSVLRFVRSVSE